MPEAVVDEAVSENRRVWDAWTGIHLASDFYEPHRVAYLAGGV